MPDEKNLGSVFVAFRSTLMRLVAGIVPPGEVEDIVQETYVRACQAGEHQTIAAPRAFMTTTARNLAFDHVKRAGYRTILTDVDAPVAELEGSGRSADETLDQVVSREEFGFFCEAVRLLPLQCRRAFVLKKVYGYTQREIAQRLGLSESTVEKHIAQGIRRCHSYMKRHGGSRTDGLDSRRETRSTGAG